MYGDQYGEFVCGSRDLKGLKQCSAVSGFTDFVCTEGQIFVKMLSIRIRVDKALHPKTFQVLTVFLV